MGNDNRVPRSQGGEHRVVGAQVPFMHGVIVSVTRINAIRSNAGGIHGRGGADAREVTGR